MKRITISDREVKKARKYRVSGNDVIGYRLALPQKAKKTENISCVYVCVVKRDGTLIYQPVKS